MQIWGLTGPSGSGKGTVGIAFSARGIPVLDTDAVYHSLIEKRTSCTEELATAFGNSILCDSGGVDRKKLAAIVFADDAQKAERLGLLNRITHRYVLDECYAWLEEQKQLGKRAAILDAPLLIEAGLHLKCDAVITVLAPRELRLARILSRDGITREAAEARISSQKTDAFYKEHADFVFINDGDPKDADRFAEMIISTLN